MGWMVGRHTEYTRAGGRTRPTAQCAARGEVRVITPRSRGEHTKCASVGKHRNCSHARLHSFSSHARMFGIAVSCANFGVSIPCPIRMAFLGLFPSTFLFALMHMRRVTPGCTLRASPLLLCYTSAPRDTASRCARNTEYQVPRWTKPTTCLLPVTVAPATTCLLPVSLQGTTCFILDAQNETSYTP
jgi:hypothetical protein